MLIYATFALVGAAIGVTPVIIHRRARVRRVALLRSALRSAS